MKGRKMTHANPLVGVWRIVAFQFETADAKERRDICDQHPSGFLIITAEGRLITLVTAGERPSTTSPDALFDSMTAYSGVYRLQGSDTFVTTVDSAWHPAWLGTEQTRHFKLDDNTLSVFSPLQEHPKFPGQRVRGIAIWQREDAMF
jgi:Lipocalin-like domain